MKSSKEGFESSDGLKEVIVREIRDFVDDVDISSKEFLQAYEIALDFEGEEGRDSVAREEVYQLAKVLREGMDKGLPLNIISELIGFTSVFEQAEEFYYKTVDKLLATPKEKAILHSIVRDGRSGELLILDSKTQKNILTIRTFPGATRKKSEKRVLIARLLDALRDLEGREIEVTFG
jgi:hypothetical protein